MRNGYDASLDPPAPILPIRVSAPGSEDSVLLYALVDTGADLSVLPEGLVLEIGLPAVSRAQVCGFDRAFRSVMLHAATLEIAGRTTICEVLAFGDDALIGRDLLNRHAILLDGPRQFLELKESEKRRPGR